MSRLRNYINFSSHEKKMFFLALYYSAFARYLTFFYSIKQFSKFLGEHNTETPENHIVELDEILGIIRKSVRRGAKYTPWRTKCMEEAIIAKFLLKKLKLQSTIYFGVSKNNNKEMIAHAWLRCGDIIITGYKGVKKFTKVASFS